MASASVATEAQAVPGRLPAVAPVAANTHSDRQLLEQFQQGGDAAETAFAELVARHGAMVLATCRGVLRDGHDAQDAFQAVFLVLSRRAGAIRRRDSLASWLYGVARRVSMKAKVQAARRRAKERRSAEMIPKNIESPTTAEPCPELFEELDRLPERFREPVVLIDVEGCTQEEASERMRCPLGTVQSRLARGRARLRTRLVRRGLAPSAGVLIAVLWPRGALAVPAALVDSTVRAATAFAAGSAAAGTVAPVAAALAKGVLKTMILIKWQIGAAVTGMCLLGAGAAYGLAASSVGEDDSPPASGAHVQNKKQDDTVFSRHVAAVHSLLRKAHKNFEKTAPASQAAADDKDKAKSEKADSDATKLKGSWKQVSLAIDGIKQEDPHMLRITFDDESFSLQIEGEQKARGTYKVDGAAKPKGLELKFTEGLHAGDTMPGIFTWDGDKLKLCIGGPNGDRPKDFEPVVGSGHRTIVFEKD
jgi:RNA polymerase sigma factor (sigma-70 family)